MLNTIVEFKQNSYIFDTNNEIKYYRIYVRQYSIFARDYIISKYDIITNDIYHYIGLKYSRTLEKIDRIDYMEIDKKEFNPCVKMYLNGKEI